MSNKNQRALFRGWEVDTDQGKPPVPTQNIHVEMHCLGIGLIGETSLGNVQIGINSNNAQ